MKKSIYIESSIPSYLTARPSRDVRAAAWQQITCEWWEERREDFDLFTSGLVIAEISLGDPEAAKRRLQALHGIPQLLIDADAERLATRLTEGGGVPPSALADAIAAATVHRMDYLLTWSFRHIDNAATKPTVRAICADSGCTCPEICTPLELFGKEAP